MKIFATKNHIEKLRIYIETIKKDIRRITDEHADAQNQSTENFGHDDAVSESILHEMALLHKKIDVYKTMYDNSIETPIESRNCVGYGKTISWKNDQGRVTTKYCDGFILSENDMSFNTPIAQVLWGKKAGDVIEYIIGGEKKKLEILRVE